MTRRLKGRLRRASVLAGAAIASVALLAAGCGSDDDGGTSSAGGSAKPAKQYTIGFVTPDAKDEFWLKNIEGAKQADAASNEVKVLAESGNGTIEDMIPVIENLLTRNVDALVVTGVPQIQAVIKRAASSGVPVISYANDLPDLKSEIKSTVATDNYAAGRKAGEYLREKLGGKGDLALLDIARGTYAILDQRVQGLMEALKGSDIRVVSHVDTGCDVAKSVSVAQNVLTRHPHLDAIFGACAQAILGAERAIKQAKIAPDQIVTMGYDAKVPELDAILAGTQDATVAQFPAKMGELSVQTALKILKGQQVPDLVDTGSELITKDNAQQYLDSISK